MTDDDLAKLDEAEKGYERMELAVKLPKGRTALQMYVASREKTVDGIQPFSWYKNYVLEGARMCNLPQEYIDSVIIPVEAKEAPAPADFT
jgi:hypothetical protein